MTINQEEFNVRKTAFEEACKLVRANGSTPAKDWDFVILLADWLLKEEEFKTKEPDPMKKVVWCHLCNDRGYINYNCLNCGGQGFTIEEAK